MDLATYLSSNTFLVIEEDIGCPFLIGQQVHVRKTSGVSPVMPPSWSIMPIKTSPTDSRFNGVFKRVAPVVQKINEDGTVIASGNIVLMRKADYEPAEENSTPANERDRPHRENHLPAGDNGIRESGTPLPPSPDAE